MFRFLVAAKKKQKQQVLALNVIFCQLTIYAFLRFVIFRHFLSFFCIKRHYSSWDTFKNLSFFDIKCLFLPLNVSECHWIATECLLCLFFFVRACRQLSLKCPRLSSSFQNLPPIVLKMPSIVLKMSPNVFWVCPLLYSKCRRLSSVFLMIFTDANKYNFKKINWVKETKIFYKMRGARARLNHKLID